MATSLPEDNLPQGMGMDDAVVEETPVGMGMDDAVVEDVTPTAPEVTPVVEDVEPIEDVDKDIAEATMARIYATNNDGTKNEQLALSAERYISELFELGNSMPELGSLAEAQKVLFDMYEIEAQQEVEYHPNSTISREEVDGINGNIRRQKKMVEEVRKSVVTPQLNIVSIPEGATPEQIKAIQTKVGVKPDGIVGPLTMQGIESFNLDQQMAAREAADTQSRIDPQTGLVSEDVTGQGLEDDPIAGSVPKTFLSHLNKREGSKSVSYLDSLGKLTGGTGHLMTAEEQAKYPKGTEIPKAVRDQWLKEDSAEALVAAKKQAKELGITDRKFIEALYIRTLGS